MKFFVPNLILSAHVWECATASSMQQILAAVQQQSLSTNVIADGPVPSGFTSQVCAQWRATQTTSESKEPEARRFLGALEMRNCVDGAMTGAVNCALLSFIKKACGDSFLPSLRTTRFLDRAKSTSTAIDENRVMGLFRGKAAGEGDGSLKKAFDDYVNEIFQGSSVIKDTIQVEKGKQELSISAGTSAGDVSVFTHFSKETNTLYVILYMGSLKTLAAGTEILKGFTTKNVGIIASSMLSTSSEESAEAKAAEDAAELSMRQSSQVASFAIDLLCRVSNN